MTTRDTAFAPGTPCWVDLMTSDPDRSRAFYSQLLGWAIDEGRPEFGGYSNARSDGHLVAGIFPRMPEAQGPDVWSTYLRTADIDATVAAATAAGATVVAGPMAVAELGSMAVLIDPAGAAVGVWQPGTHLGFTKYNEPGSVTWDEVQSKDFAATIEFYKTVFGWGYEKNGDTDDFRYYLGQVDGETVAGVMDSHSFLPAEVPSHWAVYFSVEDIDESLAKVVELGGSILRPAEDTPFGRIADALDPTGAMFKLHSEKLANPAG